MRGDESKAKQKEDDENETSLLVVQASTWRESTIFVIGLPNDKIQSRSRT